MHRLFLASILVLVLGLGTACDSIGKTNKPAESKDTASTQTQKINYSTVTFVDFDNMPKKQQTAFLSDRAGKIHEWLLKNDKAKADCMHRAFTSEPQDGAPAPFALIELRKKIAGVSVEHRTTSKVQDLMAGFIVKELCSTRVLLERDSISDELKTKSTSYQKKATSSFQKANDSIVRHEEILEDLRMKIKDTKRTKKLLESKTIQLQDGRRIYVNENGDYFYYNNGQWYRVETDFLEEVKLKHKNMVNVATKEKFTELIDYENTLHNGWNQIYAKLKEIIYLRQETRNLKKGLTGYSGLEKQILEKYRNPDI